MKIQNIIHALMFITISCNAPKSEKAKEQVEVKQEITEITKLHEEVMKLHDEEMAKMGQIHKLSQTLKAVSDTVSDISEKEEIQSQLAGLKEADESMMQWMRSFKEPDTSNSQDESIKYYSGQIDTLRSIKILMESKIHNTRSYLKDHAIKTN